MTTLTWDRDLKIMLLFGRHLSNQVRLSEIQTAVSDIILFEFSFIFRIEILRLRLNFGDEFQCPFYVDEMGFFHLDTNCFKQRYIYSRLNKIL